MKLATIGGDDQQEYYPTTRMAISSIVSSPHTVFVDADEFRLLFSQEEFAAAFLFHPYPEVAKCGFIRDMGEPHNWTADEILRREA
jgi:hypothetical protein